LAAACSRRRADETEKWGKVIRAANIKPHEGSPEESCNFLAAIGPTTESQDFSPSWLGSD
jgi:hypothetical protein